MANTFTMKSKHGVTTTIAAPSPTPCLYMIGPSQGGGVNSQGLYIRESQTGSSGNYAYTYRWVEDQNTPTGITNPTTYTPLGL